MGKKSSRKRPIEYLPPAHEDIDAYAEEVCQQIAENGKPDYASPEVINGLAQFMRIAARIQAKHLNSNSHLVDKEID